MSRYRQVIRHLKTALLLIARAEAPSGCCLVCEKPLIRKPGRGRKPHVCQTRECRAERLKIYKADYDKFHALPHDGGRL